MDATALKYLSKMPHFSFFSNDELEKIAEHTTFLQHPKGKVYAVQGQSDIDSIFVVTKGSLALYKQSGNGEELSGYIKPGEVFGGITILLNGGISLRTVKVDQDCSGYSIPQEIFQDLCAKNKSFYEYFLENFSSNILDPSLVAIIETGQVRHFLARIEPFSYLPEDEIEQIIGQLSVVLYPKDTVLFLQGRTRVGYLYILQKGSAERYYEEGQKKTMSGVLEEGDFYGGISMLVNDGISVRTLRVKEESRFYLLPKKEFKQICSRYKEFSDYFTDIFGRRMLEKSYAEIIAKTARPKEEGMLFFNQPVVSIYTPLPAVGSESLSIREAAVMMRDRKISSVFVQNEKGDLTGVVTERDLTDKVVAAGYDAAHPVSEIMSSPVRSIPDNAMVFEALMTMMQEDIRHLAVTDSSKKIAGVLSSRDLLSSQGQSPIGLLREISGATGIEQIIDQFYRVPGIVKNLITGGAQAQNVTRFITTVSDAMLEKLIGYALTELGPPPVKFAFMILGSEGRLEQTLKTDQDNAIIYEDVSEESEENVRGYFLKFGDRVCTLLDKVGYKFCTGDVMAKNPKWCQPLSVWKKYFSGWIHAAEPEDLLQASIFFDFRLGKGEAELVDSLRQHLLDSLGGWPGFFRHLSSNALHFRPPLGFFRNFVVESKGKHRDAFDIKSAMMPIVDLARIYALNNGITETNTLERLEQLSLKKVLLPQEYEDLKNAYRFLLQLRFVRQVTLAVDEKRWPDNYIYPKKLTRIEQKMLKEIFKLIEKFRSKLEVDFIGMF